jgi:hypothetical protein
VRLAVETNVAHLPRDRRARSRQLDSLERRRALSEVRTHLDRRELGRNRSFAVEFRIPPPRWPQDQSAEASEGIGSGGSWHLVLGRSPNRLCIAETRAAPLGRDDCLRPFGLRGVSHL